MKYSSSKELDLLIRRLIREGWAFRRGKKHGRLQPPSKNFVLFVPSTPSDFRAVLNFRSDLRRAMMN